MFTIRFEGLDELQRDWSEACRALSDGCRAGVTKGVEEGAAEARAVHRWRNRTGETERGIEGHVEVSTGGGAEGVIVSPAAHSTELEEGTAAHVIRARRAKALRWEDASGVHFAGAVQHPGTQASPFMGPAALKAERVMVREIEVSEDVAAHIMAR